MENSKLLWTAATEGDIEEVTRLIADGVDVNEVAHSQYETALVAAAEYQHTEVVKRLIAAGADVNAHPIFRSGRTALEHAAQHSLIEMGKMLIDAGADVNGRGSSWEGVTALQIAVARESFDMVKMVLEAGADVNATAVKGSLTALHEATGNGSLGIVKLLLDAGADVNVLPSLEEGITALQFGARGTSLEIVKLLLTAGANVNALPSPMEGGTALQFATRTGSLDMVKLLLTAGADVNGLPSPTKGSTALQFAAQLESLDMVKLLLDAGADVNGLPSPEEGRTALQFAAGANSLDMVELLLTAGAKVNAPPAKNGIRALHAAVERRSLEIVKILLAGGADVHAPGSGLHNMTALQHAAWKGSLDMVKLLITAGSLADQIGYQGRTVFHVLCDGSCKIDIFRFLLNLSGSGWLTRDHSGSSPLHLAARNTGLDFIDSLIKAGATLDLTDNTGMTPLAIAVLHGKNTAVTRLLEAGASTSTLTVDKLAGLLSHCHSAGDGGVIVLRSERAHPTEVEVFMNSIDLKFISKRDRMVDESWRQACEQRLFYFLQPSMSVSPSPPSHCFVYPDAHLMSGYLPHMSKEIYPCEARGVPTDWAWTITDPPAIVSLTPGIPILHDVSKNTFVIFVAYFAFTIPHFDLELSVDPDGLPTLTNHSTPQIAISWTMKQAKDAPDSFTGYFMRSVYFRSTHRVKYLAIPENGASFFTIFLDDVHERWLELVGKAAVYVSHSRAAQLISAGENQFIIQSLLQDSQQWALLRTSLEQQLRKSKQVLSDFTNHEVLYMELMHTDKIDAAENLPGIITLSKKIVQIEKECGDAISRLEQETKEMIGLEFNLVSIFEARRSIEMSIASNSMAMSMKRLSWVTFIFLPLMFASGLFGMNVDILSNNPSWVWYVAFSLPFMVLVLLGWILFKYIPIAKWIEDNIGSRLERKSTTPGAGESLSIKKRAARADLETGISRRRRRYSHSQAELPW